MRVLTVACWRVRSSEMWRSVDWWTSTDVSKDCGPFIFRAKQYKQSENLTLKSKILCLFETSIYQWHVVPSQRALKFNVPVFRSTELYRDRSEMERFTTVPFSFRYIQVLCTCISAYELPRYIGRRNWSRFCRAYCSAPPSRRTAACRLWLWMLHSVAIHAVSTVVLCIHLHGKNMWFPYNEFHICRRHSYNAMLNQSFNTGTI